VRASVRSVLKFVLLAFACVLAIGASLPAFAQTTTCLCANGEEITTTRIGSDRCESACEILGGGGTIAPPADQSDDEGDDDSIVVVPPRRPGGPVRPRR
jgi:hypothetical protein